MNQRALAARARALGLQDLIRLGRGERQQGGRTKDSILANAFEAVLGALYLDAGLEVARAFLLRELGAELAEPGRRSRDAKTRPAGAPPGAAASRAAEYYATVETTGPAHALEFRVEVRAGDTVLGTGQRRIQARSRAGRGARGLADCSPAKAV